MAGKTASLRASDFVDALPMPIDGKFKWKECRFSLFNYVNKAGETVATTTAARVTYESEGGEEFVQHYSVGDPKRVLPSKDGKEIVMQGDNANLNKSSNFFVLMKALEDAGLPDDFLGGDFSVLEGMVTHNIGVPEPKRVGLDGQSAREAAGRGPRILPVPDEIISMPGKGKKLAGKAAGGKAGAGEDTVAEAVALIKDLLEKNPDGVARKAVASAAIKAKKTQVATLAFKLTDEQLIENGLMVNEAGDIVAVE